MTEYVYHDQTKEGLLKFWVEVRTNPTLRDEVWKKIVELDKKETEQKLTTLRQELKQVGEYEK